MMEFDLEYTLGLFPILLKYLGTTMEMALWGFVLALVLSLILAIVRVFRVPAIHWLAMLYISFFRGTPLLVQLFLLYYGIGTLDAVRHQPALWWLFSDGARCARISLASICVSSLLTRWMPDCPALCAGG